mmetsp:Transcript_134431/g.268298  ORF Transcript_134431/g.268298 Transcript_134431/m.268298 type:complete len:336 (+) Transcript_134431:277-1284(+)
MQAGFCCTDGCSTTPLDRPDRSVACIPGVCDAYTDSPKVITGTSHQGSCTSALGVCGWIACTWVRDCGLPRGPNQNRQSIVPDGEQRLLRPAQPRCSKADFQCPFRRACCGNLELGSVGPPKCHWTPGIVGCIALWIYASLVHGGFEVSSWTKLRSTSVGGRCRCGCWGRILQPRQPIDKHCQCIRGMPVGRLFIPCVPLFGWQGGPDVRPAPQYSDGRAAYMHRTACCHCASTILAPTCICSSGNGSDLAQRGLDIYSCEWTPSSVTFGTNSGHVSIHAPAFKCVGRAVWCGVFYLRLSVQLSSPDARYRRSCPLSAWTTRAGSQLSPRATTTS